MHACWEGKKIKAHIKKTFCLSSWIFIKMKNTHHLCKSAFFRLVDSLLTLPYFYIKWNLYDLIKSHHKCEGGIEKSIPRNYDWHHKACWVMTNSDCKRWIFYPILTRIMDYFSCSPLITAFYIGKHEKDLQKILNTLRCDMVT